MPMSLLYESMQNDRLVLGLFLELFWYKSFSRAQFLHSDMWIPIFVFHITLAQA